MNVSTCIPLFPEEEIPGLLYLVLDHAKTLEKQHATENENHLSIRLCKRIRMDKRLRDAPFTLVPEFPVLNDRIDDPSVSGRVDICFLCPGGDRTYFAIEAKRLHVSFQSGWASLVSEYVDGDQGMMCFVDGKYAETQRFGAMLGFVFDGKLNLARGKIAERVTEYREKLSLKTGTNFERSSYSRGEYLIDETQHQLRGRTFTIAHLLVSV